MERKLDQDARISRITGLKHNFFIPFGRHYQLYLNLQHCLINSYKLRHPSNKEYKESLQSDYRNLTSDNFGNTSELSNTPFGFALIGLSGVGKTSAINQCLKSLPPALKHSIEGQSVFYQVPYLRIECPREGSLRQFCYKFFEALDAVLRTNYTDRYSSGHYGSDELISKMAKLVLLHHLGCLIIDEIQQLTDAKPGGQKGLMNFLISLNNSLKVPVILIGIPTCLEFLQKNLRQARRSEESGAYKWDRANNDKEWQVFVKAMWKYQWTKYEFPFSNEFNEIMYYHSQGIIDYAVRLFMRSQIRAIVTKAEIVNEKLIEQVVNDEMFMEKPMIESLRSNDQKSKLKYDDIYFPNTSITETFQIKKGDNLQVKLLNIITQLKQFNIEQDKATYYANLYINEFPDETTAEIALKILLLIQEEKQKPAVEDKKKPVKLTKTYSANDLRFHSNQNKTADDIHQDLKAEGIVRDPIEDFLFDK
jgi:hypothetical protein